MHEPLCIVSGMSNENDFLLFTERKKKKEKNIKFATFLVQNLYQEKKLFVVMRKIYAFMGIQRDKRRICEICSSM